MKKYWVIAPYNSENEEVFKKAWEYDLKNGTIAVGWRQLGNIFHSELTEEDYKKKYIEIYGKDRPTDRWSFWNFYNELSVGDIVIARKGRKKILGIGEVTSGPYYDEKKGRERIANLIDDPYSNFINVKWEEKQIEFERQIFPIFTIWNIDEEKYNSLIKGKVSEEAEEEIKEQQEFILEKYLEDFIVSNFAKIFVDQLKLYQDEEGSGQQYPTAIGNIDILAKEPKTNSYVVIELKKGRESDKVVGQILRYMGWIKENLCKEKENVKGLIICQEKDEKLEYSLKAIPQSGIEIKLYKINFQLID